jgi:hypothetical protein
MKEILKQINQMTDYLASSFAKAMKDPVNQKEDLKSELILFYLEHYNKNVTAREWFVRFKNHLIDKYRRLLTERKLIVKYEEYFNNEE